MTIEPLYGLELVVFAGACLTASALILLLIKYDKI